MAKTLQPDKKVPKVITYYHGIWETAKGALEIYLKSYQIGKKTACPLIDVYLWEHDTPVKLICTLADCLEEVIDVELVAKDLNRFLPAWLKVARNYAFSLPITKPNALKLGDIACTINDELCSFEQKGRITQIPYYLINHILQIKRARKLHQLPKELGNFNLKVAYDGTNYYLRQKDILVIDRVSLLKVRRVLVNPFENLQERIFWIEETDLALHWLTILQQP